MGLAHDDTANTSRQLAEPAPRPGPLHLGALGSQVELLGFVNEVPALQAAADEARAQEESEPRGPSGGLPAGDGGRRFRTDFKEKVCFEQTSHGIQGR